MSMMIHRAKLRQRARAAEKKAAPVAVVEDKKPEKVEEEVKDTAEIKPVRRRGRSKN